MAEAAHEYDASRQGEGAWAVGRFVVAASRLAEFVDAGEPLWARDPTGHPWRISALPGADIAGDVALVDAHNDRHAGRAVVDCMELRVSDAVEIRRAAGLRPSGVTMYAEFPHEADFTVLARATRGAGIAAKLRTGGVTAAAIPGANTVARFLEACRDAGIRCKLTAGLHHPLRGEYSLTYAPDSPRAVLFGYLNVLLAATLAWERAPTADIVAMLEEHEPAALRMGPDGVRWRETLLPVGAIDASRSGFVAGFGSCSIREPLDEGATMLQAMQ